MCVRREQHHQEGGATAAYKVNLPTAS